MAAQTLGIVGAGPKGVAVAAKAQAMRQAGLPAPEVVLFEAGRVGNHWRRSGGWTDGRQALGTSPFKDIGFPYGSDLFPAQHPVTQAMFELSWSAYLTKTANFAKWTDRGSPNPTHKEWAAYLDWVARESGARIEHAEVLSIDRSDGGRFQVRVAGEDPAEYDALMFTGFGDSGRKLAPECLSVREFWTDASRSQTFDGKRVIVIGSGETSAAITRCLVERSTPQDVIVISPTETIYSRGESFLENTLYSDPSRWTELTDAQRRNFIRRTDRAVFSQDVQDAISAHGVHSHLQGRIESVTRIDGSLVAKVQRSAAPPHTTVEADVVIDARGGNALWFLELLTSSLRSDLAMRCNAALTASELERLIDDDLSVAGYPLKIFIPNLAALQQGPGFPNLSSLGLLADRILGGMIASASLDDAITGADIR